MRRALPGAVLRGKEEGVFFRLPPSRSRSAPPMVPSWLAGAEALLTTGSRAGERAPAAAPIAAAPRPPPPVSAPARPNETDRAGPRTASKDVLALHRAVQQHAAKLGGTQRQALALQPLAEDAIVREFWTPSAYLGGGRGAGGGQPVEPDALEAFMCTPARPPNARAPSSPRGSTAYPSPTLTSCSPPPQSIRATVVLR